MGDNFPHPGWTRSHTEFEEMKWADEMRKWEAEEKHKAFERQKWEEGTRRWEAV